MAQEDDIKMFNFAVWNYRMGEQVSLMIHLGDRLGLYAAMAHAGPLTSGEVAAAAGGLSERFVREWLLGQAAAGLVDRQPDGDGPGIFELTDVQAAVLADESDSVNFAAGAFQGGSDPSVVDALVESFRSGIGITYEQQGPAAAAGLARMTGVRSRLQLESTILPGLDGVSDKLASGARVLDVGCGAGVTLLTIAAAFPNAICVGYDPSESAIGLARTEAKAEGLNNVTFYAEDAVDIPADASFDLILTFDCLHDMTRPDLAAGAIRQAISDDGTWLIKDIRSSGSFEKDSRNPMLALFYGFSVASCLQSGASEPDGLGLGTLGLHPKAAEALVADADFSRFEIKDFDDPSNLYYEVRV